MKRGFSSEHSGFSSGVERRKNHKAQTIILPVAMFGCETWSLILREEDRSKVFENRILRRTFGPKMDEATGGEWRKVHNEQLHDLCSSPNITRIISSRRMRWAGHVERIEKKRKEDEERL
jgi:hypothetical protein